MIDRRKLLAGLSRLPVIGCLFAAPAAPVFASPRYVNLADIRDLLLPGLHMLSAEHPGTEFFIQIDYTTESLLVIGQRAGQKLGFYITSAQIGANTYKTTFRSSVYRLATDLKYGPIPHGAVL